MNEQVVAEWPPEPEKTAEIMMDSDNGMLLQLAEAAVHGGREEMVALCDHIARNVLFRIMRFVPNRMDAEDVSQNVLVRVCRSISGLKNPALFRSWLNAIIRNEIHRHYGESPFRGNIVSFDVFMESTLQEPVVEDDESLPSEYILREEERKIIMSFVDNLPERQLEAILLHYFDDLSITETAEQMGVSQPAVSRYLSLARQKVKLDIQRHAEKAGDMENFEFAAVGPLVALALKDEATMLPDLSAELIARSVDAGTGKVATHRSAYEKTSKNLRYLATAITFSLLAAAVIFAVWLLVQPGYSRYVYPVVTEGEIIFTDGNNNQVTDNPVSVEVRARNDRGELYAMHWWITRAGDEDILYSGEGGNATEAFSRMISAGEFGNYTFYISMGDAEGSTYKLYKQFMIAE